MGVFRSFVVVFKRGFHRRRETVPLVEALKIGLRRPRVPRVGGVNDFALPAVSPSRRCEPRAGGRSPPARGSQLKTIVVVPPLARISHKDRREKS